MQNEISIEQRLGRIEQLLLGQKNVLTFDEACLFTGISRSYMYKLTCGCRIPHYKPNGKNIFFNRSELESESKPFPSELSKPRITW